MRIVVDIEKSKSSGNLIVDFQNEFDDTRIVGNVNDETALRIGQEIMAYYESCDRYREIYLNQLETVKAVVNDYIHYKDCKGLFSHINSFSWIDFDFVGAGVVFNVGEIYCSVENYGTYYYTEGFPMDISGSYESLRDDLKSLPIDVIYANQFADAYIGNDPIKEFIYKPFVPLYVYGMRLRGFAPACQPMLGLVERRDSTDEKYYDLLVYNMPLSEKEIEAYELDYIGLDKEEK
jgi:hypothetical protein